MIREHLFAALVFAAVLTPFASSSSLAQDRPLASVEARRGPDFLSRAVIYQVWMRSFTPERRLAAVARKLPYIADLGASIVYLSPIQEMSQLNGFTNPYRIKDYDRVDPEYGGEDDLRALVIEAHRLKLKVIMDIVYFHTAPDNVLITKHPEWYKYTPDGKIQLGPWRLRCWTGARRTCGNSQLRIWFTGLGTSASTGSAAMWLAAFRWISGSRPARCWTR